MMQKSKAFLTSPKSDGQDDGDDWEVTITIAPPPISRIVDVLAEFAETAPLVDRAALKRGIKAMLEPSTGRPPCDDRAALAETQDLLAVGRAKSIREACLVVAKARADGADIDAMAERLRRKMRKVGAKKF